MNDTRITITVGTGLRDDGSRIKIEDRAIMLIKAKMFLLTNCGGYTVTSVDGGWRDSEGTDWEEPGLMFTLLTAKGQIIPTALASAIRDIFEQRCVMLTVEPVEAYCI